MKKIMFLLMLAGFALIGASCGGGDDEDPAPQPPVVNPDDPDNPDTPDEPEYPTFVEPNWSVNNRSIYENSMTAYLVLPEALMANQSITDEMAVFCSSECRGVAERVEVSSGKYVWIAYVYGNVDADVLTVKYYSTRTRYMYQSEATFSFEKDGHYGSIDNPIVVGMKIITE